MSHVEISLDQCLRAAGWQPGRTCDVRPAERALQPFGYQLHDAARVFLQEYYGLRVDVPIAGVEGITGFVHFDSALPLRLLNPVQIAHLPKLMPPSVCPVGTTSGHTMYVFMDDRGKSYLLDMDFHLFAELANSPAEMVAILCDGRNGRVDSHILNENGMPSGAVIQADNEQAFWDLVRFPHLAPYLPTVSLSPARRPPTWRPMVRAAEDSAGREKSIRDVMVTCGGFTRTLEGKAFFVAHCENSLYVRQKAGLRVTSPPPGIAPGFRTGEIISFQPPGNW